MMSDTAQDRLAQIALREGEAADEVVRLSKGGRWTMRKPADPTRDSDLLLMGTHDDAIAMHAALTAVLALHVTRHTVVSGNPPLPCRACGDPQPCATVRAINDALGGE